ncbi:MAG TPA: amidase [Solirubrobacterales bacterium]|nr:amidase [Solirubrobacterales bacterium]
MSLPFTIAETASALRDGSITSVEVVERGIARAQALDAELGVFINRFDEQALEAAAKADEELAAGVDHGPLHGIPLGIKDNIAAAEGPTTAQSMAIDPAWGDGKDAIVIERLKRSGAIVAGKLSTMEFACGMPDPERPFPLPRNPWDVDRWPGGSSSGTGAGVAAGLFLAGLGTDTAGSIRMPASFCGVSGLKPTYGRVPNAGSVPLGYSMDHIGPLARSAQDCWLVLEAIAGPDPRDADAVDRSLPAPPPLDGSLNGLRIGIEREHHLGLEPEDPAAVPVFEQAVEALESLGATVTEVSLPLYQEALVAGLVTFLSEGLAYHHPDLAERPDHYAPSNRALFSMGASFSGADYVQSQRVRRAAQRALAAVFSDLDAIVMPAATVAAPSYDQLMTGSTLRVLGGVHTLYWDAVGNPALVVPMGFTAERMPLSLQLAAPPFAEDVLVRIGDAYQRLTDWHLQVPPLAQEAAGIA